MATWRFVAVAVVSVFATACRDRVHKDARDASAPSEAAASGPQVAEALNEGMGPKAVGIGLQRVDMGDKAAPAGPILVIEEAGDQRTLGRTSDASSSSNAPTKTSSITESAARSQRPNPNAAFALDDLSSGAYYVEDDFDKSMSSGTTTVDLFMHTHVEPNYVRLTLAVDHGCSNKLEVKLRSPSGRSVRLRSGFSTANCDFGLNDVFETRDFDLEDDAYGQWLISVTDTGSSSRGVIRYARLDISDYSLRDTSGSGPYDVATTVDTTRPAVRVTWDSNSNNFAYELSLSSSSSPSSECRNDIAGTVRGTAVVISGLLSNRTYYGRVCAISSSGQRTYGEAFTFKTVAASTTAPAAVTEIKLKSRNETGAVLEWSSAAAAGYGFVVAPTANPPTRCDRDNHRVVTKGATITGLAPGTNYTIAVCSYNEATLVSEENVEIDRLYAAPKFFAFRTREAATLATLPFADDFQRADATDEVTGSWIEFADGFTQSGGKAITYQGATVLKLHTAENTANIRVEADLAVNRPSAQKPISDVGFIVRQRPNSHIGIYVYIVAVENRLDLHAANLNQPGTTLCSATVIPDLATHDPSGRLKVEFFNDTLRVWFNGVQHCQVLDATFLSGGVSLSSANGGGSVDNFAIQRITSSGTIPDKDFVIVGPDAGSAPLIRLIDTATGAPVFEKMTYEESFQGGVRVALADMSGDGKPDMILVPGEGGGPRVMILDGATGQALPGALGNTFIYEESFRGGLFVAAGDVDGDGYNDAVFGTGKGGGPRVEVFSGRTQQSIGTFFAYEDSFRGGVRVAVADLDGDGYADIVTAPGEGGGPRIQAFSGKSIFIDKKTAPASTLANFFAYEESFRGGANMAAGDVDGDGKAEIIVGTEVGGGPRVVVFKGPDWTVLKTWFAYDAAFRGGVRVGVVDVDHDGIVEVVTAPGPGHAPQAKIFDGRTGAQISTFSAFGPQFNKGFYITGAPAARILP